MNIKKNISLKPYNTFGIDATAQHFVAIDSLADLQKLLSQAHIQPHQLHILGGGSNVLLTHNLSGYVLHNRLHGIQLMDEDHTHAYLSVASGENWHSMVQYTIERNWGGLENLSLIPGSVGAAPMQNIGAYGAELKDSFEYLEALHLSSGEIHLFTAADCAFGYRESVFKNHLKGQYFIINVVFRLQKNPQSFQLSYGALQQTLTDTNYMNEGKLNLRAVSKAVCHIRQSKLPDPAVLGNSGSFFKNPEVTTAQFERLSAQYPTMPHYPQASGTVKLAAAWLIEQCGYKGKRIGDAGTHQQHALVLVNYGAAQGSEIWHLATQIQAAVAQQFGVTLHAEVNVW